MTMQKGCGVSILGLSLWRLYVALLPKPIAGIPYNHASARSLLGDIPGFMLAAWRTREPITWLLSQARATGSPISQIFLAPFGGRPFVTITDFRETQDILVRRGKEFDRSSVLTDTLGVALPHHHIVRKTDAVWRSQRRLLQDLMLPKFLHGIAAPNIYASVDQLVQLWGSKTEIASGRPFSPERDIYYAALDAVLEFGFGRNFTHRATQPQLDAMLKLGPEEVQKLRGEEAGSADTPVEFVNAPLHETIVAILDSGDIVEALQSSPFPRLGLWFQKTFTNFNKTWNTKNQFLEDEIRKAVDRMEKQDGEASDESWVMSAVDHIVHRERGFAEKEGRKADYWTPVIRDEVFGFVIAGHETVSTTMLWGLKLLGDNQDAQSTLRMALQSAHSAAMAEKRNPSAMEIAHTNIPYLDAAIEEILRCGPTVPGAMRECMVDTVILGHRIPKGTQVFLFNQGASFREPTLAVDEKDRSPSCQASAKERGVREWDPENMDAFRPERWLVQADGSSGERDGLVFDSAAGPTMPFSLGLRACWGRRLAYLEMRIMVTMLVWNFELLPCPPELSDYAAVDAMTHKPQRAFVRLQPVKH
ncbi:cytochrome P450 [Dichotomopilus funicola]|uniref:Cytochrome P450 n=1 Tax=Dichotomopilus funicola TaxID=1934379 RepID=A0AAN6ZJI5_9PEZI|nr:cytochrome P450 [Dichotomopilus funicola]